MLLEWRFFFLISNNVHNTIPFKNLNNVTLFFRRLNNIRQDMFLNY